MNALSGMLPVAAFSALPAAVISQIFPIVYGSCFVLLLWQAFRVMARGFQAVATAPLDPPPAGSSGAADRTGRLTIHPELLDAEGQLTQEDLLTVRFGSEPPAQT